jgi:putative aldouronate transport system permease protein
MDSSMSSNVSSGIGRETRRRSRHLQLNGSTVFQIALYLLMILTAFLCLFPIVHILALSLSSRAAVTSGLVTLWPVDFSVSSYQYILSRQEFYRAFLMAVARTALGVPINLFFILTVAYPLSKYARDFPQRNLYAWFFVLTIMLTPALVPWYMTIRQYGLIDTIWALVLPGAVPVFSVLIVMNYFRGIPREMEESALAEGANHWQVLFRIYVPLALPAIATVALFAMVTHWNAWFDGLVLMNDPRNYPLQSYLQTVVVRPDAALMSARQMEELSQVSNRTVKAAQIFVAMVPMMLIYPFIQKYFTTGILLGGVKE